MELSQLSLGSHKNSGAKPVGLTKGLATIGALCSLDIDCACCFPALWPILLPSLIVTVKPPLTRVTMR